MAHSASVGSVKRTVNVVGKRLGVKKFGGEHVKPGDIILRQRGSNFYPGKNVGEGRDFTIFAVAEGFVSFRKMTGYKRTKQLVDVVSSVTEVKNILKVPTVLKEVVKAEEATPKATKAVKKAPAARKTTKKVASK